MEIKDFKQLTKYDIAKITEGLIYIRLDGPTDDEVTFKSEKGSSLTVYRVVPDTLRQQGIDGNRYFNYILVQLSIMDKEGK